MDLGNRENGDRGTMSQINVTPLVDVMLVLLVIFMVTAPMMQQGVQVNLPKADTKALAPKEDTLVVSVEQSGKTYINTSEISPDQLKDKLTSMLAGREKREVFLKADSAVPYGDVVRVMAQIKGAGVERLGMVTESPQKR
ncbi:MAG TPA: protein TolR [Geobacter sp.]|nr:protein TolR [Geobacter sp.]